MISRLVLIQRTTMEMARTSDTLVLQAYASNRQGRSNDAEEKLQECCLFHFLTCRTTTRQDLHRAGR